MHVKGYWSAYSTGHSYIMLQQACILPFFSWLQVLWVLPKAHQSDLESIPLSSRCLSSASNLGQIKYGTDRVSYVSQPNFFFYYLGTPVQNIPVARSASSVWTPYGKGSCNCLYGLPVELIAPQPFTSKQRHNIGLQYLQGKYSSFVFIFHIQVQFCHRYDFFTCIWFQHYCDMFMFHV